MKKSKIIVPAVAFMQLFMFACGQSEEQFRPTNPPEDAVSAEPADSGESADENTSGKGFVPPNKLVPFKSFSEKSPDRSAFFKSTAAAVYGITASSVIINVPGAPGAATTTVIQLPVSTAAGGER